MTHEGIESVGGIVEEVSAAQSVLGETSPNPEITGHFDDWEKNQFPTESVALPQEVTAANIDELLSGGADISPEMVDGIKRGDISLSL